MLKFEEKINQERQDQASKYSGPKQIDAQGKENLIVFGGKQGRKQSVCER